MSDKRRIINNLSMMGLLQILNYALPFVSLPYLVRVLDVEGYGMVIFAQAFIFYFIMITDFGFDLSATRTISVHRDNIKKVASIFSSILIIKMALLVFSFFIFISIIYLVPSFKENSIFFILTFGMVIGSTFNSFYIYQGLERMKYITIFSSSIKIFFTVAIFVFVNNENDVILVPIINSIGAIFVGLISTLTIIFKFKVSIHYPGIKEIKYHFRDSLQYFWSRVAVSTYNNSNVFIIGVLLGTHAAGIYSAAEKLYNAYLSVFQPIEKVLYPYISKSRNISLWKKFFKGIITLNTVMCIILFLFSKYIIDFMFGVQFEMSSWVFSVMIVFALIQVPSILLGYPLLGAMGKKNFVNNSVIYPSILHVILIICIQPIMSIEMITYLFCWTQLFVFLIRVYGVKKFKVLSE